MEKFTGINDIYEESENAEIIIDTEILSVEESTEIIIKYIKKNHIK